MPSWTAATFRAASSGSPTPAGADPLSSEAAYGPPTLLVALAPADAAAPLASIVTAPWTRNEHGALAGVKSTSYAENVRALGYAAERDGQ